MVNKYIYFITRYTQFKPIIPIPLEICRHIYYIQNRSFYRSAQSKRRHYGPKLEDALNVNLMASTRSLD